MTTIHEPPPINWDDVEREQPQEQPHDNRAERAVLGAMLQSEQAVDEVMGILRPADYYRIGHAAVHSIIIDLYANGKPAGDWMLVLQEVIARGITRQIPGDPASYLAGLAHDVPEIANASHYARIVAAHARDRDLIIAGTRIADLGRSPADPDKPKAPRAAAILDEAIADHKDDTGPMAIGDCLDDILREIEIGTTRGLSTGIADLDEVTNGMSPSMWVIGGRPSMGKSVLLVDLARAVAFRLHRPALLFSLEMSRSQILTRVLSAETGIPLGRLKRGGSHVYDNEWPRLIEARAQLAEAPLYIDDRSSLTVADIAARTRRMAEKGGLAFVGVDYLQLMGSSGTRRNDSREREVATISRGLKVLSGDVGITIAVAAQLNRGPEQRVDKKPAMSDLRESGAIEADADVVVLLHRPDYYDRESERAGEADLIVAKNRDGQVDTVTVAAQLHLSRFANMAVGT